MSAPAVGLCRFFGCLPAVRLRLSAVVVHGIAASAMRCKADQGLGAFVQVDQDHALGGAAQFTDFAAVRTSTPVSVSA